jgi:hypothetical protein
MFLDCGCCLKDDGSRVWCPTCADGGPRSIGIEKDIETFNALIAAAGIVAENNRDFKDVTAKVIAWIADLETEIAEKERKMAILLDAVKLAYRKHHMGDDSIGWEELSDQTSANMMRGGGR